MHPLTPNLKDLTDDELLEKYNTLMKRFMQAQRAGSYAVLGQMNMILDDYRFELQRRQQVALQEAQSRNPNFKNIIDIQ